MHQARDLEHSGEFMVYTVLVLQVHKSVLQDILM